MDFGKVLPEEISKINFTLPQDSAFTTETLSQSASTAETKIYTGCAKWGRKEWIGKIYPDKTKEADFLKEYVNHFNSIELNATHYKMPTSESIRKWQEKTLGLDFKFCPKVSQGISHFSNLAPNEILRQQTKEFIIAVSAFEENLGPIFLQLSDKFSPARKDNLYSYLGALPKNLSFFLELRHPAWFGDKDIRKELLVMLKENNIGAVITDTSGRRDLVHMELSIPKAFIRFVGNNLDNTDYARIDEWVQRIKSWLKSGLEEIYFFMHHPEERNSPELCDYFIEQMNLHCGTHIKRPSFITKETQSQLKF